MKPRRGVIPGALLVALLAAAAWLYTYMASCRQEAIQARQNLDECYQIVADLARYAKQPALAADQEEQTSRTGQLIDAAARQAGIQKVAVISPEPAQRVNDGPYKEKPISIRLGDNVTLVQASSMLSMLATGDRPLVPKSIRMTTSRDDTSSANWAMEAVVTYLVYDPLKPAQPGRQ